MEGIAPVVVGALSVGLGGGTRGLQTAFLIVLPVLLLDGLVLLLALRTYQPDVAAAIISGGGGLSETGGSGRDMG